METSVLSKTRLVCGLLFAFPPLMASAEILVQSNRGFWVNGTQFSQGAEGMPGIVLVPTVQGNSGFAAQRALGWAAYRRNDNASGLLLTDPAGSGVLSATTPRQANVRSHVGRANAYRLEYFKK